MLTIRLTRRGKKNQPFFKVVVIDKRRSSKGGRAVEELGYVNPLTKKISLEKERVLHWLKVGAQASPRVHNLLVSEKIIDDKKIKLFSLRKSAKRAQAEATAVPAAVKPTPETSALEAQAAKEAPKAEPEAPKTPEEPEAPAAS